MKRGLIFPRQSMQNPFTAQGLPQMYGRLSPNLKFLIDFSSRTGGIIYDKSRQNGENGLIYPGDGSGSNDSLQEMWDNGNPGGLNFDGTNDYVTAGSGIKDWYDNAKPWTWSIWVYFPTQILVSQNFVGGIDTGTGTSDRHRMMNFMASNRWYGAYTENGSSSTRKTCSVDYPFTTFGATGVFHLVVCQSSTTSTPSWTIYVNNTTPTKYTSAPSTSGTYWGRLTSDVHIGAVYNDWSGTEALQNFFGGPIISMQGYDRGLTATEVSLLWDFEGRYIR